MIADLKALFSDIDWCILASALVLMVGGHPLHLLLRSDERRACVVSTEYAAADRLGRPRASCS
ncbi:MAG: hypothetical protein MZU97_12040 [Bacillus subtilis]|nr:hypothetical protein [Bacillus subtilis]